MNNSFRTLNGVTIIEDITNKKTAIKNINEQLPDADKNFIPETVTSVPTPNKKHASANVPKRNNELYLRKESDYSTPGVDGISFRYLKVLSKSPKELLCRELNKDQIFYSHTLIIMFKDQQYIKDERIKIL